MGFRHDIALNVTPLLLRIGLGVVFLWAGGSKILYKNSYTGEEAAVLANLRIVSPAAPGVPALAPAEPKPGETPGKAPTPAPAKPEETRPADPTGDPAPTQEDDKQKPETAPPVNPTPAAAPAPAPQRGPEASVGAGVLILAQAGGAVNPSQPAPIGARTDAPTPTQAPVATSAARVYTAADFTSPVSVPRLYSLALLMHASSQPDEKGRQLWPEPFASPAMIKSMCWAAALTEFLGGALLLVGFLTRLWALALAGTMAVAMLLTTVGPAVLSGNGFLGFLPPPMLEDQARWVGAWTTMLFQFVLMLMGLGLAMSGPGALSIDRLLFRSGGQRGSSSSKE